MPSQPMACQLAVCPSAAASWRMVCTGLWRPRRPSTISAIMMGRPMNATHARYTSTNAAPPCSPVMYGNFQMLPSPTAEPMAANTNADRRVHKP